MNVTWPSRKDFAGKGITLVILTLFWHREGLLSMGDILLRP